MILQWGFKQQTNSSEGMKQYFSLSYTEKPFVVATCSNQDEDFRGIQEVSTTYFKTDTNDGYSTKKTIYWLAFGY